ncbi:fibrobacter succinogenes major paralogous domain-containing protein [Flavobacteriales bacterium]|nr:fibrobacter succinogenes major paralogous domain-containing protein [Flavobacteriales bacterium]
MKKLITILIAVALGLNLSAQDDCNLYGDLDGDSLVTINDLMGLLSVYGEDYTFTETLCDPVDFHGYTYDVVAIGEQCWFAENLRTTQYSNGDSIKVVALGGEWNAISDTAGVCSIPVNGNSNYPQDPNWYWEQFGFFYSKFVVTDSRGVCPTGWGVPRESDFYYIYDYNGFLNNGLVEPGSIYDESGTWAYGEDCGTNIYGFNARASGNITNGGVVSTGLECSWWSWTSDSPFQLYPQLSRERLEPCGQDTTIPSFGGWQGNNDGAAIRCLKDTE